MMRSFLRAIALAAAVVTCPSNGVAEEDDGSRAVLRRLDDLELLQRRMQDQLEDIKRLLTAAPRLTAPSDAALSGTISTVGAAIRGVATAKMAIVEYSDFQCPYCGQFARTAYPEVRARLIDSGQAWYVFKHFPLEGAHSMALKAAEAVQCAGTEGKFWEMHDRVFDNQDMLAPMVLRHHAEGLGLHMAQFDECMAGRATGQVRADQAEGRGLGVNSTPTFFLAVRLPEGTLQIRRKIAGVIPAARLIAMAEEVLQGKQ